MRTKKENFDIETTWTDTYKYLRTKILSGEYPTWGPLPSVDTLVMYHNQPRAAVQKALAALEAEGMVICRKGAGVYVQPPKTMELNEDQNNAAENVFTALRQCREVGLTRRDIDFIIDYAFRLQRI